MLGEFRPSPEADGKKFGVPVDRRPYGGTKYTLEKMAAYIKDGAASPAMRQFAEAVIFNSGVPRGQRISDRRAAQIFLDYVRANVRYRPDPNQVEMVQSAQVTLCVPGAQMCIPVEDCDGLTVALGSLMGAYGIQVRLMKQSWGADADEEHILVVFKSDNGDWLAADPSAPADKPVGWKASADSETLIDPLDPSGSGTQSAEFVGIGKLPLEVTIMNTPREKTLGAGFWPTWIYPSTVDAAKADLLATLQSANQTVASCTALPTATTASWTTFYNTVAAYAQPSTTSIWGLGGQMDQVQKYQAELYDWQIYLGQQRCVMSSPTTNPEAPLPPGTPSVWVGVAKLAALAAVLGAGAYGVSKVVEGAELFKAPAKPIKHVQGAASEARRLVRGKRRRSR